MGTQEAQDGYDTIEAVAGMEWCTGKVGLAGNSHLAFAQWFIAALRPPSLAAIAPWEGCGDLYREHDARYGSHSRLEWYDLWGNAQTKDELFGFFDHYPKGNNGSLQTRAAEKATSTSYDATSDEIASFTHTFNETTRIMGLSKAVLYMSCPDHDDMDVYVMDPEKRQGRKPDGQPQHPLGWNPGPVFR
ncbi:hypothetical protein Cob_v009977 [Colletotrichum orbiculare MAFF 240422]|uniref:Xaa-Pro dipeptidyl-peptidase-like domain-containing protein n=1 Tax=Colletotrichum orbiculare (strain 104-T / ATCC 96160 / CBS 514.97 / LARS 414 / MAFF 240422) TaxID=1213857 RepID=A0A484FFZ0_COLOR|nr:hypothetical protein Cob_v009977 [Colletotrichum orbiculare MAFF 240422]